MIVPDPDLAISLSRGRVLAIVRPRMRSIVPRSLSGSLGRTPKLSFESSCTTSGQLVKDTRVKPMPLGRVLIAQLTFVARKGF